MVNHRRGCSVNLPLSSLSTPPIFIVLCRCQFYCFFPPLISPRALTFDASREIFLFYFHERKKERDEVGGVGSCFDKHCWPRLIDVAWRVPVTMATTDTEVLIDTVFPLTATPGITAPIYLEGSIIDVSSQ